MDGNGQQPPRKNRALVIFAAFLGVTVVALAAVLLMMPNSLTGNGGRPIKIVGETEGSNASGGGQPINTVSEVPSTDEEEPPQNIIEVILQLPSNIGDGGKRTDQSTDSDDNTKKTDQSSDDGDNQSNKNTNQPSNSGDNQSNKNTNQPSDDGGKKQTSQPSNGGEKKPSTSSAAPSSPTPAPGNKPGSTLNEQPERLPIDMETYLFMLPAEWMDRVIVEDREQGNSTVTLIKGDEQSVVCALFRTAEDYGAANNPDFEPLGTFTCDNGNTVEVASGVDGCFRGHVTDNSGHSCYIEIYQAITWGNTDEDVSRADNVRELEAAAAGLSTDAGDKEIAKQCTVACAGCVMFN